jgi:hypothetical protein
MPDGRDRRRTDLRIVLGATIAVLLGGVVIAAAILAITSGGGVPNIRRPQPFGLAADSRERIREGGPVNFAGLSGDTGFWLALEDGRLVALPVRQPKPLDCTLRWRGSLDTFTCDGKPVTTRDLARYRSFVEPSGPRKGLLMVALRDVLEPPNTTARSEDASPPG